MLCMQTGASDSADDSGSDVATPNTVYAREVAQLFVSGRHSQFRDANTRFGSLEGSRTLSSRALQVPTPSLPSSESIGGLCFLHVQYHVQLPACTLMCSGLHALCHCRPV